MSASDNREKIEPGKSTDYHCYFGSQLSFAAAESYKLLRTNLLFSFPDDSKGHLIGITSSVRGEGKSQTAVNLSFSLAEAGKRVLLMEADLRLSPIAKYLKLETSPGLSNLLAGMNSVEKAIQAFPAQPGLDVMVAGTVPPNPSELLGSNRMQALAEELIKHYEYIIVDLPPVTAVSDAIVISKLLSGMIVVVRQDYTDKSGLSETMRQLQFVNVKILGFVLNFSNEISEGYNKKYKKYYRSGYDDNSYCHTGVSQKTERENG